MTVCGHVTFVKVFTGRTDLVAVAVTTGTDTGTDLACGARRNQTGVYNCKLVNVRFNGCAVGSAGVLVDQFTQFRTVQATVLDPDREHEASGMFSCEAISLEALE